MELIDFARAY